MKGKAISTVLVILLISFIVQLKVPSTVKASTITVLPGGSIQAAINAAHSGDTVSVKDGTYHEHVVVNKAIILTGESMKGTIIDGGGNGYTVDVTASNVVISGFTITNGDVGIVLESSSSNNSITGNTVTNNNWGGIFLGSSSGNSVSGNNLTANNNYGILLWSSSHNSITGNTVTNNNNFGIYLQSSSNNNTISGNNVTNSNWGISLDSSSSNSISRNTIETNTYEGIELDDQSSSNSIIGNTIKANGVDGIWIYYYSSNNNIYHNNFINNAYQVSVSLDCSNTWDDGYPSGGNYWSDYTWVDYNHDGIGDTPKVFNTNNTDHYPLMNTWVAPTETTVTVGGKSEPLTVSSNATVTQMATTPTTLSFTVSGPSGHGYVRVVFPKVNTTDITVSVDGSLLSPQPVIASNSTHYFIYFVLTLSSHSITITYASSSFVIPEYLLVAILGIATFIVALVIYKTKRTHIRTKTS
jgi:parallel beta-helix repeat protein